MLIIRFQRQGRKKDFVFRIVAVDSKIAVNSGKATEILGWFNPKTNQFELKKERILYWLNQGAQVSDSCYNFLIKAKIIEGQKRPIKIRKKKAKKEKPAEELKTEEKPSSAKATEGKEEEPMEEKKPEPETKEEKKEVLVEKQKEESKKEAEEKSDFKKPEK